MQTADIYLITNLKTGHKYVGQTVMGYMARWKDHCAYANRHTERQSSQLIDTVIDKYGVQNFDVQLLETVPVEEKDEKEQYYIRKYNTYVDGYNLTVGGDFNPMYDEQIRFHHLQVMQSPEHKLKISVAVRARLTPELRNVYATTTKERWNNWTEEERQNCVKGFQEYNETRKQKIAMLDGLGNVLHVFSSCSDACRFLKKPTKEAGNLLIACDKYNKNGKRSKHFGYSWKKL